MTVWCPQCGDEFREGVTHCPDCGVELVSAEVVPRASELSHVEVPEGYALLVGDWEGLASDFIEWLDDEGIPVIPITEHEGGQTKLYVPGSQLERGQQLLQEFHEEDDYEEVEVEFDEDDLSARSRELLHDGDLDSFSMLTDGPEEEILSLADQLEESGVPVLVVDVEGEELVCEAHVPQRCRDDAERILASR